MMSCGRVGLLFLMATVVMAQSVSDGYFALGQTVVRLRHYAEREGKLAPLDSVGTGFFVADGEGLFLVSAAHMARRGDLLARVPVADGVQVDLVIPRGAWVEHPGGKTAARGVKGPDVAVVRVARPDGWTVAALRLGGEADLEPLEEIVVAGYPATFAEGAVVQRPLLRKGIVAMKGDGPYVRYAGEDAMADGRVRVLDVMTLAGNSGSPVFAAGGFPGKKVIVGMVTAGDQDLGVAFAEPLSRIREAMEFARGNGGKEQAGWKKMQ